MSNIKRNYTADEIKIMDKIKRENDKCYYCGKEVLEHKRTADHKIPFSRGGATNEANIVMCCDKCNNQKDMLTDEEYIELLNIAKEKIDNNITINYINSMMDINRDIVRRYNLAKNKLSEEQKNKNELEKIILKSIMSASDGYILARDLKNVLIKIDEISNEMKEIQPLFSEAQKTLCSLGEKLKFSKSKIISRCRKEYIENLKIIA